MTCLVIKKQPEVVMPKALAFMIVLTVFSSIMTAAWAEQETIVMDSGLRYQELEAGTGAPAEMGKIAVIHLKGWLDNNGQKGPVFISSHTRSKPIAFKLGTPSVMQAWNEGVPGMKVGGRRRLMVPSQLGYGHKGAGEIVPPNADLIIEVELLEVK